MLSGEADDISSQCCLDGAFMFFIPRSKYQINICNSILHYRELMVFGAVIGGIYPSPPPMVRNVKNDLMVFSNISMSSKEYNLLIDFTYKLVFLGIVITQFQIHCCVNSKIL